MKIPLFFLKAGYFGQHGWRKVSFFKWLCMQTNYVNRVRWVKIKCKK